MGKELELRQKMDLTAENRQKLETLITEAKKTGKVSSKHLVETLDDVDATQEQTEQFYNILEQSGIEIDVSDVLDLIGSADMDNPTLSEMQAIEDEGLPEDLDEPEALPEDVENAKLDDPVPRAEKQVWFDRLCDAQNKISEEIHAQYVGRTLRCLIDGQSDDSRWPLTARTAGGRLVHLVGDASASGNYHDVKITASNTWALFGEMV